MEELTLDHLVLRYCRQVIMQAMDYLRSRMHEEKSDSICYVLLVASIKGGIMLDRFKTIICQISKEEIKTNDIISIGQMIGLCHQTLKNKRQLKTFTVAISGYDDESRELYEISEVCSWCMEVFKKYPEVFCFLDNETVPWFFACMVACLNGVHVLGESESGQTTIQYTGDRSQILQLVYLSCENTVGAAATSQEEFDRLSAVVLSRLKLLS
ncbi:MAG: hypothetical protein ABSG25_06125 [Bryobacteraceae bacterium]